VGILLIQDISSVKVQIEVPERDIARVAVGARCGFPPTLTRARSSPAPSPASSTAWIPRSRTMGIEVEIPNPRAQLKPGMFARVDAVVDTRRRCSRCLWKPSASARDRPS
jgi:multidrug efflux pump subunit AcrA (membrane-fusion protein)